MKSFLAKTIGAAAIGVAVTVAAPHGEANAQKEQFLEVLDRGVLRVGVLEAFKPWAFRGSDGELQGIEVDLAQDVADTLGVELETVPVTSANRMQFLEQDRIDLIIGGMYDTAERREVIGIVEPAYWTSGPTLMAKKGVIDSWDDIEGKPVCGKQGVYYNNQLEREFGAEVVALSGNTEAKEALRAGKCIAWVYDDAAIQTTLESGEWDEYEMPVDTLYNNPWGSAVPIEEVDSAWGSFMAGKAYQWHAEGYLLELAEKWEVRPSQWLKDMHEKHQWDDSYLEAN